MGVDWESTDDGAGSGPSDEELLDAGGRPLLPGWLQRVPRWAWGAVASAGVAIAVILAMTVPSDAPQAARTPAALAPPSATPVAQTDEHLGLVQHLAFQSGSLPVWIRESGAAGACPPIGRGISPRRQISGVVHRVMPQFRVADIGYTIDPYGALCSLQLRARDGSGATLVVSVTGAPGPVPRHGRLITSVVPHGYMSTEYVFVVTPKRWQVTVGAVGPTNSLPFTRTLRAIAQDPAMRW